MASMTESPEDSDHELREQNRGEITQVFTQLTANLVQTENELGQSLFAQAPLRIYTSEGNQRDFFASISTQLYKDAVTLFGSYRLNITPDEVAVDRVASLSILPEEIAKLSGGIQKRNTTTIESSPYLDVREEYKRLGIGSSLLKVTSDTFIRVPASILKSQFGFKNLIQVVSDISLADDSKWSTEQAKRLGYTPDNFLLFFPNRNNLGRITYSKNKRID